VKGCASVEVRQPGEASLGGNAAPASTKGATSVKLLSVAKIAAAVKPEALNPWVKHKVWRGLRKPRPRAREDSGEPGTSPRGALREGVRRRNQLLPRAIAPVSNTLHIHMPSGSSTIRGGSWPAPVDRKSPLVEKER
jgi:hypothetical protein